MTDTSRRGFLGMLSKAFGGAVAATATPALLAQESPAKVVYVEKIKTVYVDNTPKPPPYDPDAAWGPWGRYIRHDNLRRIVPAGMTVVDTVRFFDEESVEHICSWRNMILRDGETVAERLARILTQIRPDQRYWIHSIQPHVGQYGEPQNPNLYRIVGCITWKERS